MKSSYKEIPLEEIPAEEVMESPEEEIVETPEEEIREIPAEEIGNAETVAAELGEIFETIKNKRKKR